MDSATRWNERGQRMIQLRSKGERLSYVDGYNNCYKQFCAYLRENSIGDAVEKMTAVVNLINESVGKGEDDAEIQHNHSGA